MKRESNYDLLRIVAAISVIVIHIANVYYQALTDVNEIGYIVTDSCFLIILVKSLCNFAVPCFFMMSGAFNLANEKNANYKEFYSKSLRKIGIPAFVFSLIGIFYNLAMEAMKVFVLKTQNPNNILMPFVDAIKGEPFYHLWYLSVLLGLYIVTPLLITLHTEMKRGG